MGFLEIMKHLKVASNNMFPKLQNMTGKEIIIHKETPYNKPTKCNQMEMIF